MAAKASRARRRRGGSKPASPPAAPHVLPFTLTAAHHLLLGIGAAALLAWFIHARLPYVSDQDGFYHIRHAWMYRTTGLWQSAFPWTQYSVMRTLSADLWYGFHILLMPLTYAGDLARGIRIGAPVLTYLALALAYLAFRRLSLRWPLACLFVFAFASTDLLYRLTMLRPHPLSLALVLLVFAYLATERSRGDDIVLGLLAATLAWTHLALSWTAVLAVLVLAGTARVLRQPWDLRGAAAVALGLVAGWLARPHPLGAIRLAYLQVVQLLLEKARGVPLAFGRELAPYGWVDFRDQLVPIAVLLALALALLLWRTLRRDWTAPTRVAQAMWSSLVLCLIFGVLAFEAARRSNEIFVGFAVIFLGLVFTHARPAEAAPLARGLALAGAGLLILYMPLAAVARFDVYARFSHPPGRFQAVSAWLIENSRPGELVFNARWASFAPLFFSNVHNHYVSGMDPIFAYAYDPGLYWKAHFLADPGAGAFTCGSAPCGDGNAVDTYDALKHDFKASYVLVEKWRTPRLFQHLSADHRFRKVFETEADGLFEVL
jgi:hypothetical protein